MKTLISLLVLSFLFNNQILSQRNPRGDRKSPEGRIDRVENRIPKWNPDNQHRLIQNPLRTKEQQPIITNIPEPEIHQPICNPHPSRPYDGPSPIRPPHYPPPP